MVDAAVSNTVDESHEGSSPSPGTTYLFKAQNSTGFLRTSRYLKCEVSQPQMWGYLYRGHGGDGFRRRLHRISG
jgi:hypothetical protein